MEGMRKVEVLRAACCVAGIDGKTADSERRILEMLAKEIGVGEASLSAMISRAETDECFYEQQFRILKSDPKETMQLLLGVALADGKLLPHEEVVLQHFAEKLDVPKDTFEQWFRQAEDYLKNKKTS